MAIGATATTVTTAMGTTVGAGGMGILTGPRIITGVMAGGRASTLASVIDIIIIDTLATMDSVTLAIMDSITAGIGEDGGWSLIRTSRA